MLQFASDGLGLEAVHEGFVLREAVLQDFKGARLVEREVLGLIDSGHSALAYFPDDLVLLADDHAFHHLGGLAQRGLVLGAGAEFIGVSRVTSVAVLHPSSFERRVWAAILRGKAA